MRSLEKRITSLRMAVCTSLLVLCGCGVTHDVPLHYTPTTAIESFSPELQSRRFAVAHFVDSRGKSQISKVGFAHKVVTRDDPVLFVSGALADVLRRGGLKVDLLGKAASAASSSVPPGYDALIVGRIKALEVTTSTGLTSMEGEGRVALDYAVISSNAMVTASLRQRGAIAGLSTREWQWGVQFNEFSSLIDEALGRCLQNFVKDLQSGGIAEGGEQK